MLRINRGVNKIQKLSELRVPLQTWSGWIHYMNRMTACSHEGHLYILHSATVDSSRSSEQLRQRQSTTPKGWDPALPLVLCAECDQDLQQIIQSIVI